MRVTVLGCGGSFGVPTVGNDWGSCDPAEPRNRRRRPSILVEDAGTRILVDTGPDLRQQLLDAEVDRIDAVLYTHGHADHVHGLDDLRVLAHRAGRPLPAYGDPGTLAEIERRFDYAMASVEMDRGIYGPYLTPHPIEGPFRVGSIDVIPFRQSHGQVDTLGFRFGRFGYSTDVVALDEAAFAVLDGVEVWIVDATRERPHVSHAHVALALEWIERVRPQRAYLTHMNQTLDYATLKAKLPPHVEPAYDGLVIGL